MSNKPIVTVNVTLQTATVSRKGFGTPIFISAHHNFPNRVRTYNGLSGVAEDFTSTDTAYIAAQGVFSSTPSVQQFKVGRQEADSIVTPIDVIETSVHALTITVNDGDTLDVSVVTGAAETAQDVCAAMKAAIDGNAAVAAHVTTAVVGTGAAATLSISPTAATDVFGLSQLSLVE